MTTVRLPDDLVKDIDELRGDIPRERWVRRVLTDYVAERERSGSLEPLLKVMFPPGVGPNK